jgi:phage terminase small subunit
MSDKPLKNQRHERFAQFLAQGKDGDEAYELAGFKPNRGNASSLKAKQNIQDRVAAILAKSAAKVGITQERVLAELGRIGFSDLRKAVRWGPTQNTITEGENGQPTVGSSGVTIIDSSELDDDTAAAIAEVSQTKEGVRIKFYDKRAALVDLGKHLGMFKDDPTKAGDIHIHFDGAIKSLG